MRPSRSAALASALVAALVLSGCVTTPPPPAIGMADVTAAEQEGSLEELYTRIGSELESPTLTPEARAQLEQVRAATGEKLARRLANDVGRILDETPRVAGDHLPLTTLEAQRERVAPIQGWSGSIYEEISSRLSSETRKTKAAMAERQKKLDGMLPENVSGKLVVLEELGGLAGAGSEAQAGYAEQRASLVAELERKVEQAIEAENFEEARDALELVQEIDPTNEGTAAALASVNTKVFLKEFWDLLKIPDPDAAYAKLTDISDDPVFEQIRPNLADISKDMSDYYVSLGADAAKAGKVAESYRRFGEARHIQELLGSAPTRAPAEHKALVALVEKEYERAVKSDKMGLAWGYLTVIEGLAGSESATLRRRLRETRELVLTRAIKRLTAAPFEDTSGGEHKFGDAVASKVVQHLFEKIPNDVRIIEREQLGDIIREKELAKGGAAAGLAAADFLVEGTIQEAKVDSVEKTGKKTMRVVTEHVEKSNPDYNAWINLSSKERKEVPQPPKTIEVPRKEDVSIAVTLHRKVGLFSVSYRVIDADTAKVLFADSVRAKTEHEDSSSEGVELGEFKMEFKLASLPSDVEILAELADNVSAEIGENLARELANPEQSYASSAARYAAEENFEAAAQQYAYAIVLSERKNLDVDALKQSLRESAIAGTAR